MASIDKIYIYSKEEWLEAYEYCKRNKKQIFEDTGYNVMNYIYYELSALEEVENWDNGITFSNFPEGVDRWLIRNCDIDTIAERLKFQYDSSFEEIKNSVDEPYVYEPSTSFKVLYKKPKGGRIKKNPYRGRFFIDIITRDEDNNWWYNSYNCKWVNTFKDYRPYTESSCHLYANSLKAVFRQVRKWKLPKGLKIRVSLGWIGYDVYIKTK